MRKNQSCDDLIEDYFARGMRIVDGSVILPSGKIAAVRRHKKGYALIGLGPSGHRRNVTLARLVCWQEHGKPFRGAVVDHIDRDVTNDSPENLRWSTYAENAANVTEGARKNRIANGRRVGRIQTVEQRRANTSTLTPELVRKMKSMRGSGESQASVGAMFGVHQKTVSRIWREETWAGVA